MADICRNWIFYLSAFSANLIFVTYGTISAWNSPVLAKFQSNDTEINPLGTPITVIQVSLSTSIYPMGAIAGTLVVSKFPDIVGRRKTLIILASIAMVLYGVMVFVTNFWMYWSLYFIIAISISASTTVVPTYLSEISDIGNRGIFGSSVSLAKNVGQFYAYLLGPFTNFGVFSVCCGTPLFLHLIFAFFTQESPTFLYMRGDTTGAIKSLSNLRRHKGPLEIETEIIEKEKVFQSKQNKSSLGILFKTRAGRKAFFLSLIIRLTSVMCGNFIITSFLGPLLSETGSTLSGHTLAAIVAFVKIVAAILCLSIIEKIGRKIPILISCFGCGASLLGLGVYFYLKENQIEFFKKLGLLPIICIFIYVSSYTLGLGGTPFTIISELLPNESRAIGTSIVFFLCNTVLLAESFLYPLVSYYLGTYYGMAFFSFFCFTGFIIILLFLPETKGKTFLEIQGLLNKSFF